MNNIKISTKFQRFYWFIALVSVIFVISSYYINIGLKGRSIKLNSLESRSGEWSKTIDVNNELTAGNVLKAKIRSDYPGLGTILVRFTSFKRGSMDVINFKIRKEGEEKDYFSANYNTDQMQDNMLFPFGFPEIADSANKNYLIEINSLTASTGSGVAISNISPNLIGYHYFSKQWFNENKINFLKFVRMKINDLLTDQYMFPAVISSIIIPIIYISLFVFYSEDMILVIPIFLVTFIIDVLLISPVYPVLILSSILSLAFFARRLKLDTRGLYIACILPAVFLIIAIIDNNKLMIEKNIIWLVSFFFFIPVISLGYHPKRTIEEVDPNNISIKIRSVYYHTSIRRITKQIIILIFIVTSIKLFNKMVDASVPFSNFYPAEYPTNYLMSIIVPVVLIIVIFCFVYFRFLSKKDNFKIYLLALAIVCSTIINSLVDKQTSFYSSAYILKISPESTSESWVDVEISGFNFEDLPFSGKVEINGAEQRIILWSNNKIVFRTNPDTTKSGLLSVFTHRGSKSNTKSFEYDFKY